MKIAITPENAAEINRYIHNVEGKARARRIRYEDLVDAVHIAEDHLALLPKHMWVGAVVTYDPYTVPNSYRGGESTKASFIRTSTGWMLIRAQRDWVRSRSYGAYDPDRTVKITLSVKDTQEALAAALRHFHIELVPPTMDLASLLGSDMTTPVEGV